MIWFWDMLNSNTKKNLEIHLHLAIRKWEIRNQGRGQDCNFYGENLEPSKCLSSRKKTKKSRLQISQTIFILWMKKERQWSPKDPREVRREYHRNKKESLKIHWTKYLPYNLSNTLTSLFSDPLTSNIILLVSPQP